MQTHILRFESTTSLFFVIEQLFSPLGPETCAWQELEYILCTFRFIRAEKVDGSLEGGDLARE